MLVLTQSVHSVAYVQQTLQFHACNIITFYFCAVLLCAELRANNTRLMCMLCTLLKLG